MLSLSQRQSLHQRLSPQQVQYLKMLQLPVIALEQRIKQELEINPLLEELSDTSQETDIDQESLPETTETRTEETSQEDAVPQGEERVDRNEEFQWEDFVNSEHDGYKAPAFTGADNEDQEEIPQRADESLSELLLAQLRLQDMSDDDLALAEEIIGNIDDHGYLRRDLADIIDDLNKFVAATRRRIRIESRDQKHPGDGHFDSYEDAIADAPFGRDRLIPNLYDETSAHRDPLSDGSIPVDPFAVSFDDDEPSGRSHANGHRLNGNGNGAQPDPAPASGMSLQQMSQMSIEDLARLLEQGTSAITPGGTGVKTGNAVTAVATTATLAASSPDTVFDDETDHTPAFMLAEAERVLHHIQRLDPPGIGSRDLRECLDIQLEVATDPTPAHLLARRMIIETYTEFTMKHFEKVCHRLGCSTEDIRSAVEVIRSLNPKPGEGSVSLIHDNYLTPDFVIERDDADFLIIPNDRHIPTLRINRAYQDMIRRGGRKDVDRNTRKFIREKFEAAKWFIASIQQRRQTMMKVMRAIVDLQLDFFINGADSIRPMIYKDVAERIGMDISTVCRVVNGKYAQTDFGTFELRYFFSEKLETTSGEEVSTKIVKARIGEMIAAENKRKPLSDDALAKAMENAGFQVARRTVAKYREQLNIPVARLRRAL